MLFFWVYKFDQNILIRNHNAINSSKYKIPYIKEQAYK